MYSCYKLKSGEVFHRKIVDTTTKYLWLTKDTATDIYEKNCASTKCQEWHCQCCYKQCQFGCNAIPEQPVYIWFIRLFCAILLYWVWIFVFFCYVFAKFENAMFEQSSTFLYWIRSSTFSPAADHSDVAYGLVNVDRDEEAFRDYFRR